MLINEVLRPLPGQFLQTELSAFTAPAAGLSLWLMNQGYRKMLRSERWQNLRLKRLASKRGYCVLCGQRPDHPHVHHTYYGKHPLEVSFRSLKVLCQECHGIVHTVMDIYKVEIADIPFPVRRWDYIRAKAWPIKKMLLIQRTTKETLAQPPSTPF